MSLDHGGNVAKAARKYNLAKDEIIDFSANINFLGPPESVKKAIKENTAKIVNYPDPECYELKECLADKLELARKNLIVGNGAVELIYLLAKVIKPDRALVLAPTFSEYRSAVESVGGEVKEYCLKREDEFELEITDLYSDLKEVDLFFLCNPNNPTGKFVSRKKVIKLIDLARKYNTFIAIDEAFVDFMEEEISVIDLVTEYENLFVLRSLTKFFAIPGLRLGYGVGNYKLVEQLTASKDPWSVNYFAQLAGKEAVNSQEYIKKTKELINKEKEFLYQKLTELPGIKIYYPAANYILVDISRTSFTEVQLEEELAKKGILIRNCNTFSQLGDDFIRLAVKNREDNLRLLENLTKLLVEGQQ